MTVNLYRIKEDGTRTKSYKSINRVTRIQEDDDEFITIETAYDNDKIYISKADHSIDVFI
jgi:hypothetical protein